MNKYLQYFSQFRPISQMQVPVLRVLNDKDFIKLRSEETLCKETSPFNPGVHSPVRHPTLLTPEWIGINNVKPTITTCTLQLGNSNQ